MSESVACNAGLAGEDDWVRVFWLSLRGPESPANDESSAVQQHFFSCPPACCSLSHQQTWAKLHGVCHRRLHGRLPVHLALHQLDRQLADSKFVGENLSEVGARDRKISLPLHDEAPNVLAAEPVNVLERLLLEVVLGRNLVVRESPLQNRLEGSARLLVVFQRQLRGADG